MQPLKDRYAIFDPQVFIFRKARIRLLGSLV